MQDSLRKLKSQQEQGSSPMSKKPPPLHIRQQSPTRPPFGIASDAATTTPTSARSVHSAFTAPASASEEYASIPQHRMQREFGGQQVASLFNFSRSNSAPHAAAPTALNPSPLRHTWEGNEAALEQQMRARQEAMQRAKQMELEEELTHVKLVRNGFRSAMEHDDMVWREKQREQYRFLMESEQLQRERAAERLRWEREEDERVRMEMERIRKRSAATPPPVAPPYPQTPQRIMQSILLGVPNNSPLHEALRRLMEDHMYELDLIAPLIQDILHEPEFSVSPW